MRIQEVILNNLQIETTNPIEMLIVCINQERIVNLVIIMQCIM